MEESSQFKEATIKIAVIGGGPAGFFAAINCAELNRSAAITIFEASNRPLEKIRISGGGRCNVTHHCFDPKELIKNYPRGSKELIGPFHKFQPSDMIDWLKKRGVELKTETDGRIFPWTDSSATILNCLKKEAHKNRIKVKINSPINYIEFAQGANKFILKTGQEEIFEFDRLLIATGGSPQGFKLALKLNHTIIPPVPSLFTFKINDSRLTDLSGLSFSDVTVSLGDKKLTTRGPMLITHWGLSGPAILKLSAFGARHLFDCNYQNKLLINFAPDIKQTELLKQLEQAKLHEAKKLIRTNPLFNLPKSYWHSILQYLKLPAEMTWANINKDAVNRLVTEISSARFEISGKGIFKDEFVTCGGISLKEVEFKTMESKLCPGLYFAGEVLDIDGVTGGFNFQNAWTTGWIAGLSMAQ